MRNVLKIHKNQIFKTSIIAVTAAITLSACGTNYDTTRYTNNNIPHCTNVVQYSNYYECHGYTSGYNYHRSPTYKPYKSPKKVTAPKKVSSPKSVKSTSSVSKSRVSLSKPRTSTRSSSRR